MTIASVKLPAITGIGSLPHHNVDAALQYSFRHDLPFLPQVPRRNPWEYMLPQALEGLAGLSVQSDGTTELQIEIWEARHSLLKSQLADAFAEGTRKASAF